MFQQPPTMDMEGGQPLMQPPNSKPMIGPGQPIQPIMELMPVTQPIPLTQTIPVTQPISQAQPFPMTQPMSMAQPMCAQQGIALTQSQPIVVNQYVPYIAHKFKSSSLQMVCPFCHNNINTIVDVQFNCVNCCFCCCFFVLWLIVMLAQEKDLNCSNATHKCPSCGKVLGSYQSC